jgi:hypothetical protein
MNLGERSIPGGGVGLMLCAGCPAKFPSTQYRPPPYVHRIYSKNSVREFRKWDAQNSVSGFWPKADVYLDS